MLAGTMIWGAGIAAFSLVRSLPLALSLLALAGAADTLTVTFRTSIVQSLTPDEFRGRVSSVEYIIGTGGGPLGNVEAGTVASLTSPAISAFSGGIGCLAAAVLIALAFPALTRHSSARLPAAPGRRARPGPRPRDRSRLERRVWVDKVRREVQRPPQRPKACAVRQGIVQHGLAR
jgi:MFS family permease